MPGTRHAKNNTALGYFTRHERGKLGWGSQKKRLSKDSIKNFCCCTLCLKVCVDPMVCPQGDLFCKECIYQSLLTQKRKIKRRLKEYKSQQVSNEHKEQYDHRKESVDKFLQGMADKNTNEQHNESVYGDETLSCFWIPSVLSFLSDLALKKKNYCVCLVVNSKCGQ